MQYEQGIRSPSAIHASCRATQKCQRTHFLRRESAPACSSKKTCRSQKEQTDTLFDIKKCVFWNCRAAQRDVAMRTRPLCSRVSWSCFSPGPTYRATSGGAVLQRQRSKSVVALPISQHNPSTIDTESRPSPRRPRPLHRAPRYRVDCTHISKPGHASPGPFYGSATQRHHARRSPGAGRWRQSAPHLFSVWGL